LHGGYEAHPYFQTLERRNQLTVLTTIELKQPKEEKKNFKIMIGHDGKGTDA
jgi:hypothetical protein